MQKKNLPTLSAVHQKPHLVMPDRMDSCFHVAGAKTLALPLKHSHPETYCRMNILPSSSSETKPELLSCLLLHITQPNNQRKRPADGCLKTFISAGGGADYRPLTIPTSFCHTESGPHVAAGLVIIRVVSRSGAGCRECSGLLRDSAWHR